MSELASAWFPGADYLQCFFTSATCAWQLKRSYLRVSGQMLFWSALCFGLLAVNNLLVILDMLVVHSIDLGIYRLIASMAAVSVLVFGFIWQGEEA